MEKIKPTQSVIVGAQKPEAATTDAQMMIDGANNEAAAKPESAANNNSKDVEMNDEESALINADKENVVVNNSHINANSQDLLDLVESKGIKVFEEKTQKPVEIATGQDAYFAIMAQDMANIAEAAGWTVQKVHQVFYEVSCDREKLLKLVKDENDASVKRWKTLEDLALRKNADSAAF